MWDIKDPASIFFNKINTWAEHYEEEVKTMEVSEGLVCPTLQKHHQGELEFGFPVLSQIKRITVS